LYQILGSPRKCPPAAGLKSPPFADIDRGREGIMLAFIADRISSWISLEPIATFLMITTVVILFIRTFRKGGRPENGQLRAWDWIRRIFESLAIAFLFLGILSAFRSVLDDNSSTFQQDHGRVSDVNYESVERIWGGPLVQRELSVHHFIQVTKKEELPREDLSKPPLYREVTETEEVEQNSIQSFQGTVDLKLNMRKKGSAYYNGFESDVSFLYKIKNDSDKTTDAVFTFPLSENQVMYDRLRIFEGSRDMSDLLRFREGDIEWQRKMTPGEETSLSIRYFSRGLDNFYYQIPDPREIRNFSLTLTVDKLSVADVNYPGGCIPPTEPITATADGKGSVLAWKFDRAVTSAGMGLALPSPEQPGILVTKALVRSPYALIFLVTAVCLTLLAHGLGARLIEIALIAAMYTLPYIVMASVSDIFLGFWGSIVLGTAVALALSALLFRKYPRLTQWCLYGLVGFFTLLYPLIGLLEDAQTALDGIVTILVIIYLFVTVALSKTVQGMNKE
jgi:hypothetical protein